MGTTDAATGRWFLTPEERGNPATDIDRVPNDDGTAFVQGNLVRPLVHGATYFRRLHEELGALQAGDRVYFTDWRGDPDQRLLPEGPTVGEVLVGLARAGVEIRALLWRSHSDHLHLSAQENRHLGKELNDAGAEVLLDQRVRRFGSHHQKLFVIRHKGDSERDVAFVGGIDLVPRPARRRRPRRRPAAAADGRPLRRPRRPGTTPPSSCAGPSSATCCARSSSAGTTRTRSTAGRRSAWSPTAWPACRGTRRSCPRRSRTRRRPARTPSRCCAPTAASARGTRSRRRASAASPARTPRRSDSRGPSSTSRTSTCGRRSSPAASPTPCAGRRSCT